jgi:hypothetical protein
MKNHFEILPDLLPLYMYPNESTTQQLLYTLLATWRLRDLRRCAVNWGKK